jgi:hypothetical protein
VHITILAVTGHGKGYTAQAIIEDNIPDYAGLCILDYKGEYRGLVKPEGGRKARHWMVGPREVEQFGASEYAALLRENPRLVFGRHRQLDNETWQQECDTIIAGARRLDHSMLYAVEEGHTIAPEKGGDLPDNVEWLAKTGRSSGHSALWISQRSAEIAKAAISQSTGRFIGGFMDSADVRPFRGVVPYNADVHVIGNGTIPGLDERVHHPEDGPVAVRQFRDDGSLTGSEWVYSDRGGSLYRIDTSTWDPESPHYGPEGKQIRIPEYDG